MLESDAAGPWANLTAAAPLTLLWARARTQPHEPAYTFASSQGFAEICWRDLAARVDALGQGLAQRATPGDRVLIALSPGLDYIVSLFACWRAGLIAVPAFPARGGRRAPQLAAIAHDCRPAVTLCSAADQVAAEAFGASVATVAELAAGIGRPGDARSPIDTAILQYTSGSTGAPKGVIVSHANLLANLAAQQSLYGVTPASRGVIWLPPHHDMGLGSGVLQPLYSCSAILLMDPGYVMQRPLRWLEAMHTFGGTVSGAPPFAFAACASALADAAARGDIPDLDLSAWRCAFVGAEPVRPGPLEAFAAQTRRFGFRPDAFVVSYGLAEATLLVSGARGGLQRFHVGASAAVSCGAPAHGHEVRIVDPDTGAACPDGVEGEVWVRGPSVGGGYWGDEARSAATFRARTADGDVPFLRTGDLGVCVGGRLAITGRLKDVVIVAGCKLHAADVEAASAAAWPGLSDAAIAAFGFERDGLEKLGLAIERPRRPPPEWRDAEVARAVRAGVARAVDAEVADITFTAFGGLPRTTSGKLRRAACGDLRAVQGTELVSC